MAINRTKLELKQTTQDSYQQKGQTINRTKLELKRCLKICFATK